MECIFCKIAKGEIPSKKIYEDDSVLAFYDIDPKAPVHLLIIPKDHISSVDDITPENSYIISHIFEIAKKLSKDLDLACGYRIVTNCGKDAGQTVDHLHFHMLAGRSMQWPPG